MAEQNLIDTLGHAMRQVGALFKTTADVVKARLGIDGTRLGLGVALFAAALVLVLGVIPLLVLALVWGLVQLGLWPWAAYLVTAGVAVLAAAGLALVGKRVLQRAAAGIGETAGLVKDSIAALGGAPPAAEPGAASSRTPSPARESAPQSAPGGGE
ncbi:MAG: phage holin family protein [Bifidobacteriaceae bacterium]|jgi:hypothetical protein|nr:phage holin family protein [Bifidobacteriaceae bacterium]